MGMIGGFRFLNKSYTKLPYEIIFALDKDKKAVETYNKNFKICAVANDIEDIDCNKIGHTDLIVGGFPCQSFSTVNPSKDPYDERGQLYKHMARFLKEKKPKAFIAENVKGMLVLKKGSIFSKIVNEFLLAGYKIEYKLLNAADYGIPQKRQRVFIVGVRDDLNMSFKFPESTHSEIPSGKIKKWVGIGNIIKSLVPEDPKYYFSQRAVDGMKKAKNNMKRGLWQNLEQPCLTITSHLAKVSINSRDPVLLVNNKKWLYRRFTPREAARIQSFPDKFEFVGSESDAYRQIGQAIAPVMMWHIANSLYRQVFC